MRSKSLSKLPAPTIRPISSALASAAEPALLASVRVTCAGSARSSSASASASCSARSHRTSDSGLGIDEPAKAALTMRSQGAIGRNGFIGAVHRERPKLDHNTGLALPPVVGLGCGLDAPAEI